MIKFTRNLLRFSESHINAFLVTGQTRGIVRELGTLPLRFEMFFKNQIPNDILKKYVSLPLVPRKYIAVTPQILGTQWQPLRPKIIFSMYATATDNIQKTHRAFSRKKNPVFHPVLVTRSPGNRRNKKQFNFPVITTEFNIVNGNGND